MEKIILRKDYMVETLPVEKAVGKTLVERACSTWTETFIDEDTKEKVNLERREVIFERGKMLDEENIKNLQDAGVREVTVTSGLLRAKEFTEWHRVCHVKVTLHCSNGHNAVLIVRSDSLRHAVDLAADYAEGAFEQVFNDRDLTNYFYITKVEVLNNIRFIGRTNEDIEKEGKALAEDPDVPKKEPFKVKATFIDTDYYDPTDKHPSGIHKGDIFVVWAYDMVTAKNIVFEFIKKKFHTTYNDRETLRVVGASQFFAHTYVPAEYCNEYIEDERMKLKIDDKTDKE